MHAYDSNRKSDPSQYEQNGAPAPAADGINPHRRVSQMAASVTSDRSQSPISRTGTPGAPHDPNIAPQHLFDGVATLPDPHFGNGTPSDPALHMRQPSPARPGLSNGQHPTSTREYEELLALNTTLRTRVSELEVINMVYSDNEQNLCRERDQAIQERDEYKRKAEELERQLLDLQAQAGNDDEHISKKPRLSPDTETQQQ
jgi:GATA-binding protein, other eukaryote